MKRRGLKFYGIITSILFFNFCQQYHSKVLKRYSSGSIAVDYISESGTGDAGMLRVFFEDGRIYKELPMLGNKYVGVKRTYYQNGKIAQLDSLTEPCDTSIDACDGTVTRYSENGIISQRYTIKDNTHNGPTWQYREDGSLAKQYILTKDSIKNGYYLEFYTNGNVANKLTYKHDTINGMSYHFLESGDTVKYCNHVNGHESFPYKIWFDKNHSLLGTFSDYTQKTVTWIWYENDKEIKRKTERMVKGGLKLPI